MEGLQAGLAGNSNMLLMLHSEGVQHQDEAEEVEVEHQRDLQEHGAAEARLAGAAPVC